MAATGNTGKPDQQHEVQHFWAAFSKFLLRICENKTMNPPPYVQVNERFI